MKTVSFSNNKGGVAKTTTTAAVGELLAARGKRVLMLDFDVQGNLSGTFGVQSNGTTANVLMHGTATPEPIAKRLHIVSGTQDMAGVELQGTPQPLIANLRAFLRSVSPDYDFVLIDTPPALGIVSIAAFACSDFVFIPTQAEPYAFTGLQRIVGVVEQVQQRMNPALQIGGILLTRHNEKRKVVQAAEQALRNHFGKLVLTTTIHESVAVVEAVAAHRSIATYAPKNRVAVDYLAATNEILKRIKQ